MIRSPIIRNDRLRHSSIRCMESGYCQKSGAPQISFCNALEENSQVKTFKISTNSKPIFIPGGRISDHFHITGIVNGSIPRSEERRVGKEWKSQMEAAKCKMKTMTKATHSGLV